MMALLADQTTKIKLGHMVTNPAMRDPTVLASAYATLQDISNGRMIMGVGRGDSAVRYVGRKPMKVADFEEALKMVKPFMNGKEVRWNDKDLQLKWVRPELPEIEMHVAGYGPKALAVAGRQGDGVIIQLADPDIIQWIMATARKAAEEAGRDPAALKCIVSAPSHISDDLADAREQVRWFPAMVSNHVQDLIDRYGTDGSVIPQALTDYVEARKFYDYNEHSRVGAKHGEFVTDEICDRFCVLGNAEQAIAKLRGARVDRRRPVQHLPDDEGPGRDARGLRRDILPRLRRSRGVEARTRRAAAPLGRGGGRLGGRAGDGRGGQRARHRGARGRDRAAADRRRARPRRAARATSPRRSSGRVAHVISTDLSPAMVEAARRRGARGHGAPRDGHAGDRPAGRERRRRRLPVRLHARPRSRARVARDAPCAPAGRPARVRDLGAGEAEPLGDGLRAGADRARAAGAAEAGRAGPVRARASPSGSSRSSGPPASTEVAVREVAVEFRFASWEEYRRVVTEPCRVAAAGARPLDDDTRAEVDEAARARLERFQTDEGYVLPGVALVTSAR